MDRELPLPVRIAQEIVNRLAIEDGIERTNLQKKLSAFAMQRARAGLTVEPEKLLYQFFQESGMPPKAKDKTSSPVIAETTAPTVIERYQSTIAQFAQREEWGNWKELVDDANRGNLTAFKTVLEYSPEQREVLATGKSYIGACVLSEALRRENWQTITELKKLGCKLNGLYIDTYINLKKINPDNLKTLFDLGIGGDRIFSLFRNAAQKEDILGCYLFLHKNNCHNYAYEGLRQAFEEDNSEAVRYFYGTNVSRTSVNEHSSENDYALAYNLHRHGIALDPETKERIAPYTETADLWMHVHKTLPPGFWKPLSPYAVNLSVMQAVTDILGKEEEKTTGLEHKKIAYAASVLFMNTDQLFAYFKKWGSAGKAPLHNVLHMIEAPDDGRKELDKKAWGDAVMKHGPEMARLFKFADKLPRPVCADDGTWSLVRTREEIGRFKYAQGHKNPTLAGVFYAHALKENDFDKALELIEEKQAKNLKSSLPDIYINGARFDMPQAVLRRLGDDDVRGLILGELTDCCQTIGNHGSECAIHGFTSKHGSFYTIAERNAKGQEEILGQAWAWRGKNNELVLDTLETLGNRDQRRVSDLSWEKALQAFANEVAENTQDITALMVGKGGDTPKTLKFPTAEKPAVPLDYNGYRESLEQFCIWERPRVK